MTKAKMYCAPCKACGLLTSKAHARTHDGLCKACVTGTPRDERSERSFPCPDCGVGRVSAYQKSRGYHCDACTRETDPEGWRREVMGLNAHDYDEPYGYGD
jgi:predicted RNA-binding Zn-ribbon protein involved in translation (DUF1610 family)